MLIASSGLLDNQGLDVAANLTTSLDSYTSVAVVDEFATVIDQAEALGNTVISDSTLQDLRNLGNVNFPALTDSFPSADGDTPAGQFSGAVLERANVIMGNGDLTVFAQIYSMCRGYQSSANQFINSANSTDVAAATFIDMDAITTGGLSLVTGNVTVFGQDLAALGTAVNPADLANLGFPSTLLRQVFAAGGLLPGLQTNLEISGVTREQLSAVSDSTGSLAGTVERNIYTAMQNTRGDTLSQVLFLLDVTTSGITTMADLLDPVKMFPNSYLDLRLLIGTATESVYLPDGSVNSGLETEFADEDAYQLLKKILPGDQALANRAVSRSMFQIKNVLSLTLPDIAASATLVQSNEGLSDINTLSTPVPAADAAAVKTALAPGNAATGTDGAFTLYDFIGTAAGYPYEEQFTIVVETFGNIADQGGFASLVNTTNGAYVVMQDTLAGDYGNVSTGPITGVPAPFNAGDPYANADVAFQTYITVTQGLIDTVVNTYPTQATASTDAWDVMVAQYQREPENWQLAMLEINELMGNNRPAIMSLSTSLHEIGTDQSTNGPADFFKAVANAAAPAGQAVIASLREGSNIKVLEDAGIGMDTQLPAG